MKPPVFIALSLCVFLCGCGRQDRESRVYGPDAARIAGDTAPWSNPPYNGDQHAWELQTDKRARLMNEYARIR